MSLPERFAGHMGHLLGPEFPAEIGLAVSGGADSMAMLALCHDWARIYGVGLRVVTVNHGLRADAADEAAMVAEECAVLGHRHTTLTWQWDGHGNLQDAARRARLDLIGRWRGRLRHVLFAHTKDDVAETLLMRLARGSGVEGLSAVAARRDMGDWAVIRPLLDEPRAALRHHVETLKVPFVDDPSNADARFQRARTRDAIAALGLDTDGLARTAQRLARAKNALRARAADVARGVVTEATCGAVPTGDLLIDRDGFSPVERDTQLRLLAGALCWVSSTSYRPRASALEDLLDRALSGGGGTLHGARVLVERRMLRICREYRAIQGLSQAFDGQAVWDSRWHIAASGRDNLTLRALGPEGWQQIAEKPADAPPHDAAIAMPALFAENRLVACSLTTLGPQFQATLHPQGGNFVASLDSR